MELRQYQKDACNAVWKGWQVHNIIAIVLCTGAGKTIIASKLIEHYANQGKKILFLANREELIQQASDKLMASTGLIAGIEKGQLTTRYWDHKVTVGSIQTLARSNRMEAFAPDTYDYIIADECHGCMSEQWQKVFGYFNSKVLGLTATFMRGDKKNLGSFFEDISFQYNLKQAIRDGFLSPIIAKTIPLEIDLSKVKTQTGDFKERDIAETITPYLDEIAASIKEHAGNRKILIFLPLIETSEKMVDALRKVGFTAEHIDGKSKDRKEKLENFSKGTFQVLCNAMLLTHGYDEPSIDCVVVLRVTQSSGLYIQMCGRGTRLSPGKKDLLLLDFLWHSAKHKLHSPASLYASSEEEAEIMNKTLRGAGKEMSLEEMKAEAANEIHNERESKLAQYIDANRTRKARTIDPLNFGLSVFNDNIIEYEPASKWEKEVATGQQLETLEKLGFDFEGITKGYASTILGAVRDRRDGGLATPKQLMILLKNGYSNASTFSFEQASSTIDWLAKNRWGKQKKRRR